MKKLFISALAFAPMLASAQNLTNLQTLLTSIGKLVSLALPIVVGLALLAFFWGLLKFIFAGGDADKRKESTSVMIYGVVALFVMVSVWGLVNFIGNAVGIPKDSSVPVPTVTGLPK